MLFQDLFPEHRFRIYVSELLFQNILFKNFSFRNIRDNAKRAKTRMNLNIRVAMPWESKLHTAFQAPTNKNNNHNLTTYKNKNNKATTTQ